MNHTTAIIGAGIAGLALARTLRAAGRSVEVFDKARGPGGRMASRRLDPGTVDLGAQYLTARDLAFRAEVERWSRLGVVALWTPRLVRMDPTGTLHPVDDERSRFVGTPRMSAITRALARDLPLRSGQRIAAISGEPGERWLHDQRGDGFGPYEEVLLALPAPQAMPLLEPLGFDVSGLAAATYEPCWAVGFACERRLPVTWDAAVIERGPLTWLARNGSKPGRGRREIWVAHAAASWSRDRLDDDPDRILDELLAAARELIGHQLHPLWAQAHRWRYARVAQPAPRSCYHDPALGLGACGDWGVAGRIEGAWRSAQDLAHAIRCPDRTATRTGRPPCTAATCSPTSP